jgi:hypothetical protein
MAKRILAIKTYCPTIELGDIADVDELAREISGRTTLSSGEVKLVLEELYEAVLFFNRAGRPVRLKGLGIYTPVMKLTGKIQVSHRLDKLLSEGLNVLGKFIAKVKNAENKGKTVAEIVAMWDADNPSDPVEDP